MVGLRDHLAWSRALELARHHNNSVSCQEVNSDNSVNSVNSLNSVNRSTLSTATTLSTASTLSTLATGQLLQRQLREQRQLCQATVSTLSTGQLRQQRHSVNSVNSVNSDNSVRISLCTDIAHETKIAGLPQICILTLSLRNLTQPNFCIQACAPDSTQHIKEKEN